ncbi:AhpC/TSA family protein [Gillisia sp. Hel1_33_143]|uniref:TlpA family protein disulfide reductase n=1 Tax=Gillisia sp. Hel1_33_143 TaxID=1336796 RepID=UPI00087A43B4|nr:TlpA disulfide reductase family protein [Gillisia sp. Hel1_33_143]SDS71164.1 AhpC/TSA family protein [Gillisia sp. Hel1_33_143]
MHRFLTSIITIILVSFSLLSCNDKTISLKPKTDTDLLQKDFITWWNYQSNAIRLAGNFIPLDQDSKRISKEEFLKTLTSGNYIPVELESKDDLIYYKIFKINKNAPISINQTITSHAITELKFFKMEGAEFPNFKWTDLQNNNYTSKNTKGKILVIKCWFINCYACIKEFPDLNELVENYKDHADIKFISLALDTEDELKEFLIKRPLSYSVIPDQEDFLKYDLKITYYPTHIILGKDGKVLKVVTNFDDLEDVLKYDLEPTNKN